MNGSVKLPDNYYSENITSHELAHELLKRDNLPVLVPHPDGGLAPLVLIELWKWPESLRPLETTVNLHPTGA